MRTETITMNIYKYDELNETAQERARDWWREGGLDYDWWESTFEDARRVGVKIKSFDTYGWEISGDFIGTADETAEKIISEHGADCGTTAEARHYQKAISEFLSTAQKDEYGELATYALEHEQEDIEREFLRCVLQEYLHILQKEGEYLLSDEAAEESIRANDYEFTESGKIA